MTTTPPAGTSTTSEAAAGKIPAQSTAPARRDSRSFTTRIEELCRKDPGARSALRSGLGKDLDAVPRMHRPVAPWLPEPRSADVERAYYAVAAMIASQPRSARNAPDDTTEPVTAADDEPGTVVRRYGESLGTAFATAVTEGPGREKEMRAGTAESRLNLLTRQSVNGLHRHLPASVGYLRSLGVDIDWAQLLDDLGRWRTHSGQISRRWLQDFYRLRAKNDAARADRADEQELLTTPAAGPDPS
ncbi:type I-E CRISPR-associated protein Cse2/CasB [Streptomyces brevispora]|uniref:type I-E CRISPR-associated protein Cse2/CasB n=1 Tax=Streptomyces brevispora TaxID=887462 RepID=UPI002E318347|nr:type I-E CRISPR-associated protein Cse2/CasB [Streptomyces brevispora]